MKINKKILIPVFATAMGLSVIGGVGGAVAWYQYNSKVNASYVGMSVADSGVLQIRQGENGNWTRAVSVGDANTKIRPVTFGDTSEGIGTKDAWMYPEAGAGNGYYEGTERKAGWVKATKNVEYAQFDLYFSALQTDPNDTANDGYTYVERDVYISRFLINCLDENGDEDDSKLANNAMRIQIDVEGEDPIILANDEYQTDLFGDLDLDNSFLDEEDKK